MELQINTLIQNAGKHGISIRNLKKTTSLSKNSIKRIIFNSTTIQDCNPYLHGSSKRKIHVYSFKDTFDEQTYIEFKKGIKKRNLKISENNEQDIKIEKEKEQEDYIIV